MLYNTIVNSTMIYGIGSDLLNRQRIAAAFAAHPKRFAEKLLSPKEYHEFSTAKHPVNYLAKRWAAKEAIGKALGTGIRQPVLFPAITIARDALGKPLVLTEAPLSAWLHEQGIGDIYLTLTDEGEHVLAFALAMRV